MVNLYLMRIAKKKYISYILRFTIAATALYLAFRGENLFQIADVLFDLNIWIVFSAFALWFISQLIFVARWSLLLKVQDIKIGFWTAVRLHLLGIFYNNCLPTAVGGDLIRAWYVTNHTDKKVEAALSVFVDRIIGLTGMIIMACSCYWFIPTEGQKENLKFSFSMNIFQRLAEYKTTLLIIALSITTVSIAFVSIAPGRAFLGRILRQIINTSKHILKKIHKAIVIYYNRKLALCLAMLLTFCCQGTFIVGLWLIGREIGIDANAKYYFIFFPVAWVLGALPISIGALGIWEGMLKLTFARVTVVSDEQISALALAHRIIWLIGSIPGVIVHLSGAHLPKDFSVDYEESVE